MLDGGQDLEPEAQARVTGLANHDPDHWAPEARATYMAPQFDPPPGQTRRFGSDFAQEPLTNTIARAPDGFGLRASRAVGGLSSLWGAAVLPNRTADMADWPIQAEDLAPHYRAVAGFLPMAGDGAFDALFPALPLAGHSPLPLSPQAQAALDHAPDDPGLTIGPARIAVSTECRACGLCLHGCPWGHIFSARLGLAALRDHPRFMHRTGPVHSLDERADHVMVRLHDGTTLAAPRVFLGAGVLETARIALASGWAESLTLADSPHGFLPLLTRRAADPAAQRHTLAALMVEMDIAEISPFLIHSQIYGYNEFYAPEMAGRYGRILPGLATPLFNRLSRHLMVAQTFLHSDHGPEIGLTAASDGRLNVTIEKETRPAPLMVRAQKELGRALRRAGLYALTPAAHTGTAGSSFHVGGTLPMGDKTDILGRPKGLTRTHVIDASSLPAIAATTITLTVMANAHRIGATTPYSVPPET